MANSRTSSTRFSASELRATVSLAAIFALRMLGLFMIMPVFAVYAKDIPGGHDTFLVGLAIGIYGLTQSLFYIPYGWVSDYLGRKPVIVAGLLLFALGSLLAAFGATHQSLLWIIAGRALQGAGAISSVVIACIADLTHEENRTKAMAMVGASIGVAFAVAIVTAPLVFHWIGMAGLFDAMAVLSLAAIAVVLWVVPAVPKPATHVKAPFSDVLHNPELLRLNFGVYALHATQTALFVVLPPILVAQGLALASAWKIYLPVMGLSFFLMVPAVIIAEKRGQMKSVLLAAIAAILIGQLCLASFPHTLTWIAVLLLVYFTGFNVLEATQPSLVSKLAPGARKGAAMGVYNTAQALGLFSGGAVGGWLLKHDGSSTVFFGCAALVCIWLVIAATMKKPPARRVQKAAA